MCVSTLPLSYTLCLGSGLLCLFLRQSPSWPGTRCVTPVGDKVFYSASPPQVLMFPVWVCPSLPTCFSLSRGTEMGLFMVLRNGADAVYKGSRV